MTLISSEKICTICGKISPRVRSYDLDVSQKAQSVVYFCAFSGYSAYSAGNEPYRFPRNFSTQAPRHELIVNISLYKLPQRRDDMTWFSVATCAFVATK